ncbi:protein phosphatase 1 regulatory subunit 15B [Parambassis ranga]|uniref:Protein phosphatase 1 regulatory subunit 15B n=1 Tax=Parambassis ranga TaxID=210632 RepID=A0A6P7KA48_9TELE|nr:protein phosphatase 1 regulatory subunit 15B-like [Parambassis ranga]
MFRNLSTEGHLTESSASAAAHGVTSAELHSQDSSWIGLLSRPALSFLHRVLPGRARHRPQSEDFRAQLVQEGNEFLRQLDDILPASGTLPWLTADSLRELGMDSEGEDLNLCPQTHIGYLPSVRTVLSHVLLSSQVRASGGKDVVSPARQSWPWWGSFWEGETGAQRELDLSRAREGTETDQLCHRQPAADTKSALPSSMFAQSGEWTLGEKSGPADHKEQPTNNGGLHIVQNPEGSTVDQQLSTALLLSCSGATAGREAPPLTPDPDNGYYSLEEEQLHMARAQGAATPGNTAAVRTLNEQESVSGLLDKRQTQEEAEEDPCVEARAGPQCQNKAIAFIIGCPCSDDDSSQSDTESDDDDGFDSEGSSDMSDSMDEDDEASDSDGEDSEAERLWSSLCQSNDPYNPRNFTARLHTVSTRPQTIPPATPSSSTQSTPASSPNLALSSPLPSPSSPASGHDTWDDSTSASELDEAESARLWSSFSCSSDPYSPFNFQAPLRTRGPTEAPPRARVKAKRASQTPPCSPHHDATSPPEYRKEEAEERLDSGFSEAPSCSTSQRYRAAKKVRFCDDVEEFFASCGEEEEDRRGPWEELARDRCRFLRRCQEVEQSIAYCLQPQHRSLVLQRLSVLAVQDA